MLAYITPSGYCLTARKHLPEPLRSCAPLVARFGVRPQRSSDGRAIAGTPKRMAGNARPTDASGTTFGVVVNLTPQPAEDQRRAACKRCPT